MDAYVEITKGKHDHGGQGWEFGTCLWSRSRNRAGVDRYSLMRESQKGGRVIHIYNDTWSDEVKNTRAARAGVSIYKLAQWMGHSDVGTTEVYAHPQAGCDPEIGRVALLPAGNHATPKGDKR